MKNHRATAYRANQLFARFVERTTVMLRKMNMAKTVTIAAIMMFAAVTMPTVAHGALSFTIGGSWDTVDRQNAATAAMQAVVNRLQRVRRLRQLQHLGLL